MTTEATASRRERPWRLRRRLGRAFLAVTVVLALLGAAVAVSTIRFVMAGNHVIYTWQPALAAGQRLLTDLVNEETGVRGFALTGQDSSLQPYVLYRAAQRQDAAALRSFAADQPRIRAALDRFVRAADGWERAVAVPAIRQTRSGGTPGTQVLDAGQAAFDRVRRAGAALTEQIRSGAEEARSSRVVNGAIAAGALGLAVLVIIAMGIMLWRGLRLWVLRPVDSLGGQTRHVAAGQLRHEITVHGPVEIVSLGRDVDSMRAEIVQQLALAEEIQEELRRQGEELERSNSDLQQFAYVASHDLSEPLRKVSNFCQLLERQYADQLDDRAHQYIFFAVDGAKRMQVLITDLLALSRVGRTTDEFVPVELDAVLERVLNTLSERIEASDAKIERVSALPTVSGDANLLGSLLENLIGNAIKYRRDGVAPHIRIGAEHDDAEQQWTFTVVDNGIGIAAEYGERIFQVFQRLHLRDQYGGTGIGLALCRKIVEFHGGRIWLDPVQSENGATFRFTLPEGDSSAQ
ncbi:MAG TPA: ATP-binding protein [Jatrophihabitans sp.]|nr:ATP-binding protein [Jatrophihabitans sp.]